jgi:hypothetical protein
MPFKIKAKQLDGNVGSGMYTPGVAPEAESTELGGAPSRTANTWSTYTVSQVLDQLLFKYQSPGMDISVTAAGAPITSPREVGHNISTGTDVTLSIGWNTTDPEINAQANQVTLTDPFGTLATAQPIDGSRSQTYTNSALTPTAAGSRTWTASGLNTKGGSYSRSATINWVWKGYWGSSFSPVPDESVIKALSNQPLPGVRSGSFTFPAGGGFKYFAFDEDLGVPNSFLLNGLPFALSALPPFTLVGPGTIRYTKISITNDYGRAKTYNVFRSGADLSGAITVIIS